METKFDEMKIAEKLELIEKTIKEKVAPMLAFDGGSCELIDVKPASGDILEIYIRYLGACSGCSSSGGATLFAIEDILRKELGTTRIRVLQV